MVGLAPVAVRPGLQGGGIGATVDRGGAAALRQARLRRGGAARASVVLPALRVPAGAPLRPALRVSVAARGVHGDRASRPGGSTASRRWCTTTRRFRPSDRLAIASRASGSVCASAGSRASARSAVAAACASTRDSRAASTITTASPSSVETRAGARRGRAPTRSAGSRSVSGRPAADRRDRPVASTAGRPISIRRGANIATSPPQSVTMPRSLTNR